MEEAFELGDDLFFADLNKQMSQLIMDDGDDDKPRTKLPSAMTAFSSGDFVTSSALHEQKGTGVFIPPSPPPQRRKHQWHRRSKSFSTKSSYMHQEKRNSRMVSNQLDWSNYFPPTTKKDLTKQISQLTMDDDGDDNKPRTKLPSGIAASSSGDFVTDPALHEQKGTGVFIPPSPSPQRRGQQSHRRRSKSFSATSSHMHQEKRKSRMVSNQLVWSHYFTPTTKKAKSNK